MATQRDWDFNEYTQYFRLTPQPRYGKQRFFGIIEAYVERPLRDIIKSPWVFKYALALVKEMMGRSKSRFEQITLPGGGTIAGSVFLTEAQQEKEKLETMLQEGRGFGEAPPPMFVIG